MLPKLTPLTLITSLIGISNSLNYQEGSLINNVNLQNEHYGLENTVNSGFMPDENVIDELNKRFNKGRRSLNDLFNNQEVVLPKNGRIGGT